MQTLYWRHAAKSASSMTISLSEKDSVGSSVSLRFLVFTRKNSVVTGGKRKAPKCNDGTKKFTLCRDGLKEWPQVARNSASLCMAAARRKRSTFQSNSVHQISRTVMDFSRFISALLFRWTTLKIVSMRRSSMETSLFSGRVSYFLTVKSHRNDYRDWLRSFSQVG